MDRVRALLRIIGIPVLGALFFLVFFESVLNDIMSVAFLTGLPFLIGVSTILLSKKEHAKSRTQQIFLPWLTILAFFILTTIVALEGFACWVMMLPIFLLFSSMGGVVAGYFLARSSKNKKKLSIAVIYLIPFLISPVEHWLGARVGQFTAVTSIQISAPAGYIWKEVVRVSEIQETEDSGWLNQFLGIPRPIKAELSTVEVGAVREAIFSDGLVFTEKLIRYQEEKLMEFTIEPNTSEIPATTFDEHIVIGGQFFDVLVGRYKLTQIDDENYMLYLESDFQLNTTFNFYSGLWARWIMTDIQNNILRIVKNRSEKRR